MELNNIKEARNRIKDHVKYTDLRLSPYFSTLTKGQVFLKLENQQVTHAFKIRGALNKLKLMRSECGTIITASSGNHGQAVAKAAQEMGLSAEIIVPERTPNKKKKLIQKYGAHLTIYGQSVDQAELLGRKKAKAEQKQYISPYNDTDIIAGQGTIGLEIKEQNPKINTVLVPIGGGGLISGIAVALKYSASPVQVIGIQANNDAAMYHSLQRDQIVHSDQYPHQTTIADGLAGGIEPEAITFSLIHQLVDEVILVREKSIKKAIQFLWEKENLIAEGAGVVGLAALLENPTKFSQQEIAIVISGGNIDRDIWENIIKKQN